MPLAVTAVAAATMAATAVAAIAMAAPMTTTMLLGAILIVAVRVTMAFMAAVALMSTSMSCFQLRINFGLHIKVQLGEVSHIMRAHIAELGELYSALHCRQDLSKFVDISDAVLDFDCLLC